MRVVGLAAGSAMVATAALLLGSGTAIAATGTGAPVASSLTSEGGTGGDACAHLPVGLQELLCPSPTGADGQASGAGSATSGTGSGTGSGSAPTGGTTGTAPASGASASTPTTPPGVVSNFLIWLAGLFQAVGL